MAVLGKETLKFEHKAQALANNLQDKMMAFEKQKQKMVPL
jgi:hypothetical protein